MPHLPARLFFTIIHIGHIGHISFIFHTMKTKDKKQIGSIRQVADSFVGNPRMAQNVSSHLFPSEFPYFEPTPDMWKWLDVKKRLLF
ncbi:MAG: hypothetical protein DYG98_18725 [Haliscomenobacteraceae bacterium CHB4]|nr:hypothetical protein [Haliscomenobacteraceae bacterium CHB4]